MASTHEANVGKLLVKLLREIRDLREDLARRAGEPVPEKPEKPKAWGEVTSVTRDYVRHTTNQGAGVPSALTPEMREAEAAQRSRPPRHGQPVNEPVGLADVRVSDEVLRNFGVKS